MDDEEQKSLDRAILGVLGRLGSLPSALIAKELNYNAGSATLQVAFGRLIRQGLVEVSRDGLYGLVKR